MFKVAWNKTVGFVGDVADKVKNVGSKVVTRVVTVVGLGIGFVSASVTPAYAQLTPLFTLDFAQAQTDLIAGITAFIAIIMVGFGFSFLLKHTIGKRG
jgi:p-aminobenzoyl-glutamate transporter AbgT